MIQPLILLIDDDPLSGKIRRYVLELSGYSVLPVEGPRQALSVMEKKPDAIVCNLGRATSTSEVLEVRRRSRGTPFIALTDTPYGDQSPELADRFAMKLDGPKVLLEKLDDLLRFRHHVHPELEGKHVVFVDSDRRYVEATQQACDLIGYRRAELLGKRIEDVAATDTQEVTAQFAKYLKDGSQEGVFVLRHKSGHLVPVFYKSLVLPDGCMAARWEPASGTEPYTHTEN
ncbi:MAG TPA: PAS domain S-box protein [Terriglobales bacterium]